MRVDPAWQRRGIGTELCDTLLGWARGNGYAACVTNTSSNQPAAAALYRRASFTEAARTPINDAAYHLWFHRRL